MTREFVYFALPIFGILYTAVLATVVSSIFFYVKFIYHCKILAELSKQEDD